MPQFTKNALIDSFIKLINEMSLDKITIKDIVDDCGVNRNTFYYYFHDIYAMLDEVLLIEAKKVLSKSANYQSWEEVLLEATKYALENKKAIYHAYNSLSREIIEQYLYNIVDKIMYVFVSGKAKNIDADENDIKFIVNLYKYALVGMLLEWISKGMKNDMNEFINKMDNLFDGSVEEALRKSERNKSRQKQLNA